MTEVPWTQVVQLDTHDLSGFSSGRASVDDWLLGRARSSKHLVATHLCLDATGYICGFFALCITIIETTGLSRRLRSGSDAQGRSSGILLAQMGLDEPLQGNPNRYGRSLFLRAAREAGICADVARMPLLVVDAADEPLVGFYEKCGMTRLSETGLRLVAPLSKISRS